MVPFFNGVRKPFNNVGLANEQFVLTVRSVLGGQGPRRAPRGHCQEPGTGLDDKERCALVRETSGQPPLLRTAGPAM